jgi:hypothetical protein
MRSLLAILPLVTFLATGCGGSSGTKTVSVKGRLVAKDGTAFKLQRPGNQPLPPGDPGIRVKFTRVGETPPGEDASYNASVNGEDGTFEVPGKANKGIPPGKYLVTVAIGAAGELSGKGPPKGGPPGSGAPSMDGIEVAKKEVTVPDDGVSDLTIEVSPKQ